jgi:hypothetical protein
MAQQRRRKAGVVLSGAAHGAASHTSGPDQVNVVHFIGGEENQGMAWRRKGPDRLVSMDRRLHGEADSGGWTPGQVPRRRTYAGFV